MVPALTWLGVCAVVVLPVLALRRLGARWRWFALGVTSWAAGVAVKVPAQLAVDATGIGSAPWAAQAAVAGLLSAATELGAAACFLWRARLPLPDALAFGAGIGAFEVLFVLAVGWLEGFDAQAAPAERFQFVTGVFLLERALAVAGHTASRVLLYAGLRRRAVAVLLAVALFALIDGTASYAAMAQWDWDATAVAVGFYGFLAAAVGAEAAAAWWFGRPVFGRPRGPNQALRQTAGHDGFS